MARFLALIAGIAAVVSLTTVNAGAQRAITPKLLGTVGPGFTIALTTATHKKVVSLKHGTYSFVVSDKSPIHNFVPRPMQVVFKIAWSRAAEKSTRFLLSRVSHVPKMVVDWTREAGPYWGNEIATLHLDVRAARMELERTKRSDGRHPDHLHPVTELTLAR